MSKNINRAGLALFAAALLLAGALPPVPAFGQATTVTTSETVPVASTVTNPCNGDAVAFSGNMHVVNHVTTDSAGGTHLHTHTNFQDVSGVGAPSGATYRIITTRSETINDSQSPQAEMTVIQVLNLIGQGSTPNFKLHMTMHITINANGTTTSTVEELSVTCRGRA